MIRVRQKVRIDIKDNSDYNTAFINLYHDKVGTVTEITGTGRDALYTVAVPDHTPADFAEIDLDPYNVPA